VLAHPEATRHRPEFRDRCSSDWRVALARSHDSTTPKQYGVIRRRVRKALERGAGIVPSLGVMKRASPRIRRE
jgi:hypothetical protein